MNEATTRAAIALDEWQAPTEEYRLPEAHADITRDLVRIPEQDHIAGEQIYFRGPDDDVVPLEYDMPFLLYWNPRGSGSFHPVGLWADRDVCPQDEVSRDSVLEWRIRAPRQVGDPAHPDSYMYFPLQARRAGWSWRTVTQRRGADYYLSVVPADNADSWPTRGIRLAERYEDRMRFALYLDLANKSDSWISDEHNTGSIRMQNSLDRRASLVAVRYGTGDAFGARTSFTRRGWTELVG